MRPARPDAARPVVRTPAGPARPASAATRARARRRRAGTAALAALAVLVVGAALPHASASRLEVRAERAGIVTRTACTTTAVEVVPDSASAPAAVALDGLTAIDAAACSGAPVAVTLFGATGVLGTAEGTLTTADQEYALTGAPSPSEVTRVRVLVGGFAVPGTWRVPGPAPDSCDVVYLDGSATGFPCEVTGSRPGSWWGSPGAGFGQWFFHLHADIPPDHGYDTFIRFHVTVPEDPSIPSWWSWSNAVVTTVTHGGQLSSSCSDLPLMTGQLQANVGGDFDLYVEFRDTAVNASGIVCQP